MNINNIEQVMNIANFQSVSQDNVEETASSTVDQMFTTPITQCACTFHC